MRANRGPAELFRLLADMGRSAGQLCPQSIIPKKPAPDLIRGGTRFSEKIMRK